jgi:hypothetical protein
LAGAYFCEGAVFRLVQIDRESFAVGRE